MSFVCCPASPSQLSQGKELWIRVFGDDRASVEGLFSPPHTSAHMLVLLEGEEVRSCLTLLSLTLCLSNGESLPTGYVYALCTHPDHRGRGYAGALLSYADFFLRERGCPCALVLPAGRELEGFYRERGYRPCFYTAREERGVVPPCPGSLARPAAPDGYGSIREALLRGKLHTAYPAPLLAYQADLSRRAGGDLVEICTPAGRGCAAVEYVGEDTLLLKELLAPAGGEEAALSAVAARFPARRYLLRSPRGEGQPFGMIKWYYPVLAERWAGGERGYLGLAFD